MHTKNKMDGIEGFGLEPRNCPNGEEARIETVSVQPKREERQWTELDFHTWMRSRGSSPTRFLHGSDTQQLKPIGGETFEVLHLRKFRPGHPETPQPAAGHRRGRDRRSRGRPAPPAEAPRFSFNVPTAAHITSAPRRRGRISAVDSGKPVVETKKSGWGATGGVWDEDNACFIPRVPRRPRDVIAVDSSESTSDSSVVEVQVSDVTGGSPDMSGELDLNMDGTALDTWLAEHDPVEVSDGDDDDGASEVVCDATHSTEEGVDPSVDGSTIDDEITEDVPPSWTGPDGALVEALARALRETHPVATVGDMMAPGAVCLAMLRRYGDDVDAWRVDWDVHFRGLNRVRVGGSGCGVSRAGWSNGLSRAPRGRRCGHPLSCTGRSAARLHTLETGWRGALRGSRGLRDGA